MNGNATYHLAKDAGDYRYVHQFLREQGEEVSRSLTSPTVAAIDGEGAIVGVLGTTIQNDMIVAGPLLIAKELRGYRIIIHLIDFYDLALSSLGITSYVFSVEKGNDRWLNLVKRVYDIEPYAEKDGVLFFIKRIGEIREDVLNERT